MDKHIMTHRIMISRASLEIDGLFAINLDSKEQCFACEYIDNDFIWDCATIDALLVERYEQGLAIEVGMSDYDWALWAKARPAIYPQTWLSICSKDDGCISAVDLTTAREVITPPAEFTSFHADLIGFNAASYEQGFGVVCRMAPDVWQLWLEAYEVAALDDETAVMLSSV